MAAPPPPPFPPPVLLVATWQGVPPPPVPGGELVVRHATLATQRPPPSFAPPVLPSPDRLRNPYHRPLFKFPDFPLPVTRKIHCLANPLTRRPGTLPDARASSPPPMAALPFPFDSQNPAFRRPLLLPPETNTLDHWTLLALIRETNRSSLPPTSPVSRRRVVLNQ